jgi:hypothetical protein
MPTFESHNRALRQRDALAVDNLKLRERIRELECPDAKLDLAALVAENEQLRSEVRRLTEAASDKARALRQLDDLHVTPSKPSSPTG